VPVRYFFQTLFLFPLHFKRFASSFPLRRSASSGVCMQKNHFISSSLLLRALSLFVIGLSVFVFSPARAAAWQANTIGVVSAASYEANCASESIAAAFGTQLSNSTLSAEDADPATPGIQLPTTLGGTTVEVAGRAAGIFFVSPGQVNFLLPANLSLGNQAVVIRNNGTAHNGTVTIAQNAPAIFTFNATGLGVIAGNALRIRNSAALYEDLAQSTSDGFITRAIDLGPATDQVFLVFYGTGWRQAGNATRVLLGGELITPQFAGAQGSLAGLDQINALIPRSLLGRGRLSVVVAIPNTPPSNAGEAEVAGVTTSNSPLVNSFVPDTTQAGQTVTINGSGFVANVNGNTVRIGNTEAQVISASASQIVARVPYGSDTSKILVRTVNGDGLSNNALRIRTSMSGVVESTNQQPLTNVIVRSLTDGLRLLTTNTALNGTFVLSEFTNPQNGSAFLTIDGSTVPTTPKFGTLTINQNYLSGRDTQFGNALTLQQVNGTSGQVGGSGLQAGASLTLTQPVYVSDESSFAAPNTTIKAGDVTFELPADAPVRFPDGSTSGQITLTVVERALLPVRFPAGLWSSAVVQITPFGTTFGKGGRLRFPNPERYPAGAKLFVCQFDQGEKSGTLGQWIAPASAVVTSDGQFVETEVDAIKQGAYYFLVGQRPLTSVAGRVLESDRSPTRRARVRIRGQEALTDGNGGFLIRNVPVSGPSNRTAALPNSVTNVGVISLPDPSLNQPPVLLIASALTTPATKQVDYEFYAYDYDDRRVPRLAVTGAAFAQIIPGTIDARGQATPSLLRLAPTANQLGTFSLVVTATDSFGATVTRTVVVTVIR
jgi:uncharacterized protein (TIGR03437 family)